MKRTKELYEKNFKLETRIEHCNPKKVVPFKKKSTKITVIFDSSNAIPKFSLIVTKNITRISGTKHNIQS